MSVESLASKPAMVWPETKVEIPKDADQKHIALMQDKAMIAERGYCFGVRLDDLFQTGDFKNVTFGGPYPDWTTYLRNGLAMTDTQARKYLLASRFPGWCSIQQGIEKVALLYRITELTQAEETPEEAMALMLPTRGGGLKAFAEMTVDEVTEAYRLLRNGQGDVERSAPKSKAGVADQSGAEPPHFALQSKAIDAVSQWIKPKQVRVRNRAGKALIFVSAIPEEDAAEVFEALAQLMRSKQR